MARTKVGNKAPTKSNLSKRQQALQASKAMVVEQEKVESQEAPTPMVDRSTKIPLGVWENVPMRIDKFFIPVDFVIVDMEEDSNIPIILGRPFLHTAGAVLDVKYREITLKVGDETITFC